MSDSKHPFAVLNFSSKVALYLIQYPTRPRHLSKVQYPHHTAVELRLLKDAVLALSTILISHLTIIGRKNTLEVIKCNHIFRYTIAIISLRAVSVVF